MFENIVGHRNPVEQLKSDIGGGKLPRVLLFHGDPYSGKLTTALETARVLTCSEGRGEWTCGCGSCASQRLLLHQSTLLLGTRQFMEEITATAEILKRHRKSFAQYLFLRAVRKLSRRFDPVLWEGQEAKLKKPLSAIDAIEEDLEYLAPGRELPGESALEERIGRVVGNCADVSSAFGSDNIPVNQVRRIAFWSHMTMPGERKVVIVEGADNMQAGTPNALLKNLEEPPEDCTFILLTANRGGVIPTILSRARAYYFPERGPQEADEVLRRIFKEESGNYRSIREYFLAWNSSDVTAVRTHARRFVQSALSPGRLDRRGDEPELDVGPGRAVDKAYLNLFLFELHAVLQGILRGEEAGFADVPLRFIEGCLEGIRDTTARVELYNQNPALALEALACRVGCLA